MKSRILPACLAVVLATFGVNSHADSILWTNLAGGNWSVAANWQPNQVPGAADDALIITPGTYVVTLDVSAAVNSLALGGGSGLQTLAVGNSLATKNASTVNKNGALSLSSGVLGGPGLLAVAGQFDWTGGRVGPDTRLTVATNGVFTLAGNNGALYDFSGVLTNAGTIEVLGGTFRLIEYNSYGGGTGELVNLTGALVDISGDEGFDVYNDGTGTGSPSIINRGTLRKSSGAGTSPVNPPLLNSGTLDAQTGTVTINGGGDSSGQLIAEAGATLDFANNYTVDATGVISGAGIADITGNGTFTLNGWLTVSNSSLSGGLLAGSGIIANDLVWTGGHIAAGSTLTVATNGILTLAGNNGTDYECSGILTNAGTISIVGGQFRLIEYNNYGGGTGELINLPGGLVDISSDGGFDFYNDGSGTGSPVLINQGMLRKSAGSGTTVVNPPVINSGTLDAQSGTLLLDGGGDSSGQLVATAGAELDFGNDYTADSGSVVSGAGTVAFVGGSFTLNGLLTTSNSKLTGAVLGGGGTIATTLVWSAGRVGAGSSLTVATNGVLTLTGNNGADCEFSGVMTNAGTIQLVSGNFRTIEYNVYGGGTGKLINLPGALVDIQGDVNIDFYNDSTGTGSPLILNLGTFRKSGLTGVTSINTPFYNSGIVEARSGTLSINGGGDGTGQFISDPGATLQIINSYTVDAGGTFSNAVLAGGALVGTNVIGGTVIWNGDNWSGATVTIASNAVVTIAGTADHDLNGGTLTNYGTVIWTGGKVRGGNGATIYNYGIWDAQNDQPLNDDYGSGTTFYNFGTFRKSAGTGSPGTTINAGVTFYNPGTLDALAGTISLGGGGDGAGQFIAAPGAMVAIDDDYTADAGSYFSNVVMRAGSLVGANTIAGTMTWTGGNWVDSTVTIASNGVVTISGSADHDLPGETVTNLGTVIWSDGRVRGGNAAVIYNYGVWNAQNDQVLNGDYGGGIAFYNLGTFIKSAGSSSPGTVVNGAVSFYNSGSLSVQAGGVYLSGPYDLTAGSLNFGLNSATNYGQVGLAGNPAVLGGTVSANFNNGYSPSVNDAFAVLNYASFSGGFTNQALPAFVQWQTNYTPTNFVLTVLDVVPIVNWSNPSAITYGTALGAGQLDATPDVPGTFAYTPPAGTVLDAGTYLLSAIFTPNDTSDHNSITSRVSLVVSAAPLTVTGGNFTRQYGQANPAFTGSVVGLVNGDVITANFTSAATATSVPGAYPILPILIDPNTRLANYAVTTNAGALTITPGPEPTLTSLSVTVGPTTGGTAVILTGTGFENGATVAFGGKAAQSVGFNGPTSVTATTPVVSTLGSVDVVLTNPDGNTVTLSGAFTFGLAPAIQTPPANQSILPGNSAQFAVHATGTPPLAYQWRVNGSALVDGGGISGSATSTLTINNALFANGGVYSVIVSNPFGTNSSAGATLTITNTGCIAPPAGIVAWWPGNGDATDLIGGNSGTLEGGVTFAPGVTEQAFALDGSSGWVDVPNSAALNPVGPFSVECWIKAAPDQGGALSVIVDKSHGFTDGAGWLMQMNNTDGTVIFGYGTGGGSTSFITAGTTNSVLDNQWHHLAGVWTGSELEIFLDGGMQGTLSTTTPPVNNQRDVEIGRAWGGGSPTRYFHGSIDEVSYYATALTPAQVSAIYAAGSAGKCVPPPIILAGPASTTNFTGDIASFGVTATGTQPLGYQWWFNQSTLAGQTNAALLLPGISAANVGNYLVVVSDAYGSTTSSVATLTVETPVCVQPPSGLAAWWPANGTADDIIGGNNGILVNGATFAPGEVGQAYLLNGSSHYIQTPYNAEWAFGTNSFTLELWANFASVGVQQALLSSDAGPFNRNKWIFWLNAGSLQFHINGQNGTANIGTYGFSPVLQQWYHLAVTRQGTSYTFYIDGNPVATNSDSTVIPDSGAPLMIGQAEGAFYFSGLLDEASIYNRALSAAEIASIHSAGSAGKCVTEAPTVATVAPLNPSATLGANVTFVATANGASPLGFQWRFDGINLSDGGNISGSATATLTIANAGFANAGSYQVVVTNTFGAATSQVSTLVVPQSTPAITWATPAGIGYGTALDINQLNATTAIPGTFVYTPPAGTVPSAGTNILKVLFTPTDTVTYSQVSGTVNLVVSPAPLTLIANNATRVFAQNNPAFRGSIVGAVNGDNLAVSFSTPAASASPPGTYPIIPALVDPDNRGGNYMVSGVNGLLTISSGPATTITFHNPASGSTNGGTQVIFGGSGFEIGATVSFGPARATGVTVSGPTGLTATTPPGAAGTVDIVLLNPDGTGATVAGGFTYGVAPTIQTGPVSQTNVLGGSAQFTVQAAGQAPLTYQWQLNGNNLQDDNRISGSQTATLAINGTVSADAGIYRAVVTNPYGTANSQPASLSLILPPTITTGPKSQSTGTNADVLFSVAATGASPLSYQWYHNGGLIAGATGPSFEVPGAQLTSQGNYTVVITNVAGAVTSAPASLTLLTYCASVQTTNSIYPMGVTIPFNVNTHDCGSSAATPGANAVVWILGSGAARAIPVTTDASGNGTAVFTPLPGETGIRQYGVALPGQPAPTSLESFTIIGMALSQTTLAPRLVVGFPQTYTLSLSNLTLVGLSGIYANAAGQAPNVHVQIVNVPTVLSGSNVTQATFQLAAEDVSYTFSNFKILFTTAEGVTNILNVNATMSELEPALVATPSSLVDTMIGSNLTLVSFTLTNQGAASSGPVTVRIPSEPWLSLVTTNIMPSLAPGATNQIILALTPSNSLPIGSYPGTILIDSAGPEVSVPFTFTCVSTLVGAMQVTVQDELSFYGAGSPNVSNATVTLTEFPSGAPVASAVTGPSGVVFFPGLTSDYYNVTVDAPDHGRFSTTLLLAANQTNDVTAFLPLQLVNYTWTVMPTQIQDSYDFTLITVFQTQVPWPVVTVTPGQINLCEITGETNQIDLVITNNGLIAAENLQLVFGTNADWEIIPLASNLGDLAAESGIVVPAMIIRLGTNTSVPSNLAAQLNWSVTTPTRTVYNTTPIFVYNANPNDCSIRSSTPVVTISTDGGGGGGGYGGGVGGGSGYGGGGGGYTPSQPVVSPPNYVLPPTVTGVAVDVTLEIDQRAVISRNAFKATLNLNNSSGGEVTDLSVTLNPIDASGNAATNAFFIQTPQLMSLDAVDGTGTLAVGASGTATWTIIPTTTAAPFGTTNYAIGGTLAYKIGGEQVTIPLFAVPITVLPDPRLVVDYFLEHDVYSDDPFTAGTEASIPFDLAIMMRNTGLGTANDVSVTSSQPEITRNDNGLLIGFQLIGSQVGTNQAISPSLTVDLGDIAPGTNAVGLWSMTCTLEGSFISYQASFKHTDALGGTNTSIIDSVKIHELTHAVRITNPVDDEIPDFLVNDTTNVDAPPGIVYSSDGKTYPVTSLMDAGTSGLSGGPTPGTTITVTAPAGYIYFDVADPADGTQVISSVKRSDGVELLVGPNVWQTPRRVHMIPAQNEDLIHVFDYNSTGSYTVTYGRAPSAPDATTTGAKVLTSTSIQVSAEVDPNGDATRVYFEWGTTTNYGNATTTETLTNSLYNVQTVELPITGLSPGTLIHYRVVAINDIGTTIGTDFTFGVSAQPPDASTLAASGITGTNATLNALVNPEGDTTSVYFQWGPTTGYGNFTATNVLTANLNTYQNVTAAIGGYAPGTIIHFRAAAVNTSGIVTGADMTILPYPRVTAALSPDGSQSILSWPTNYPNFALEFTTNLVPPVVWSPVTTPTGIFGGNVVVTNSTANREMFFRLKQ